MALNEFKDDYGLVIEGEEPDAEESEDDEGSEESGSESGSEDEDDHKH